MQNELPQDLLRKYASNLDDQNNLGNHWVAYEKINNQIVYFKSFGKLRPP